MRKLAASFLLAGLLAAAPTASATYPGRNGELLAFVGYGKAGQNSYSVVRVDLKGRRIGERQICAWGGTGCAGIRDAAVAPDGRQLVVVSGEYESVGTPYIPDLRLIALGGGIRRIPLPTVRQEGMPWTTYRGVTWSPDGKGWLIQRSIGDGAGRFVPQGLNLVGLDGADQGQLVDGDASEPEWSSRWEVAFIRGDVRHGQGTLWVRRPDGTLKQLTSPGAERPSWSPDGRKIAFAHGCHHDERDPQCGIHMISSAGGPPRLIARRGRMPVWSPDGTRIAFLRLADDLADGQYLYVADTKRHRVRRVTSEPINPPWNAVSALEWRPIQSRRALRHTSTTSRTEALR